LALDFLSPESLGEAVRLAEEVRRLPNEHEAKLQVLEVSKANSFAHSCSLFAHYHLPAIFLSFK